MKLSEIKLPIEVVQDEEFDLLGMATSIFPENRRVLSFLNDEKYVDSIRNNKAISSIVTTKEIYEKYFHSSTIGIILSEEPKKIFFMIHNCLAEQEFYWKKFENKISGSAQIHERAIVEPHSVRIGEHSIIEAGAVIKSGSIIGDHVIIRSGTVVGGEGFQFSNFGGEMLAVRSGGRVVIENGVEIQHNSCIDKGVLGGDTIIKKGAKIDNLVHIAHDVQIGERSIIIACTIIGGRTIVGEEVWTGPNSTVSNGLEIGDHARISLGAVVTQNVEPNATVTGNFAIGHKKFIDFIKSIR